MILYLTMEAAVLHRIYEDLEFLKKEIMELKEHMIDSTLTRDEELLLQKARKEHEDEVDKEVGKDGFYERMV